MRNREYPSISIVIPAFNEERYIGECLKSLTLLDYPADLLEVIVVDNGSTDGTVGVANLYGVKVISKVNVRVGAVRNYGASESKGDYIAFLDGDCIPSRGWLSGAVSYMDETECDVVGGICLLRSSPSWVEDSWVINPRPTNRPTRALIGGSILIKREVFFSVGGFDEVLSAGEDTALGVSLNNNGFKVHLAECCAVIHLGYPRTLWEFMRRQYWHTSSYLKSVRKGEGMAMFAIVLFFLIALITFVPFLILAPSFALYSLVFILLLPLVLTIKRVRSAKFYTLGIKRYLGMFALDFCYLLGRAGGLAKSLLVELKIINDKKSHY